VCPYPAVSAEAHAPELRSVSAASACRVAFPFAVRCRLGLCQPPRRKNAGRLQKPPELLSESNDFSLSGVLGCEGYPNCFLKLGQACLPELPSQHSATGCAL